MSYKGENFLIRQHILKTSAAVVDFATLYLIGRKQINSKSASIYFAKTPSNKPQNEKHKKENALQKKC